MHAKNRAFGLVVIVAVMGLFIALMARFDFDVLQESTPKFYQDFQIAENAGATKLGWLPPFLPSSATNIREKHNFDYNRVIVSFQFSPSDFQTLVAQANEISPQAVEKIRPSWLAVREPWFSDEIIEGLGSDLSKLGFMFYEYGAAENERIRNNKLVKWYVAANPSLGIAYAWN